MCLWLCACMAPCHRADLGSIPGNTLGERVNLFSFSLFIIPFRLVVAKKISLANYQQTGLCLRLTDLRYDIVFLLQVVANSRVDFFPGYHSISLNLAGIGQDCTRLCWGWGSY